MRSEIEEPLLVGVRERIREAGESLRNNDLPSHKSWCGACDRCDLVAYAALGRNERLSVPTTLALGEDHPVEHRADEVGHWR